MIVVRELCERNLGSSDVYQTGRAPVMLMPGPGERG